MDSALSLTTTLSVHLGWEPHEPAVRAASEAARQALRLDRMGHGCTLQWVAPYRGADTPHWQGTAAPTTAHGDGLRRPQAPPVSSTPEVEEYLEGPWEPWWAPAHDVVRNWMGSSTWECAGTPVSRFWSHHLAAIGACTFIAIASVSAASSQVGVIFTRPEQLADTAEVPQQAD